MRPNSVEILQGIQGTLMTYVQPEVQGDYARTELMLVNILLGIVANAWDGAAQGLVDDNAALRDLVGDAEEVATAFASLGEMGYTDVIVRNLVPDPAKAVASTERLARVRELVRDS